MHPPTPEMTPQKQKMKKTKRKERNEKKNVRIEMEKMEKKKQKQTVATVKTRHSHLFARVSCRFVKDVPVMFEYTTAKICKIM